MDLEAFISRAVAALKVIEVERDTGTAAHVSRIRAMLSMLLTNGISGDIEFVCQNKLGVPPSSVSTGMSRCVQLARYTNSITKHIQQYGLRSSPHISRLPRFMVCVT